MKAKILILSALIVAVLVSSGCVQQKCPESCEDGNDCTKDYCSAVTNYACVNKNIVPCCGNGICEENDCGNCTKDCSAEQCVPFTAGLFWSNSYKSAQISGPIVYNISEDHIYLKIVAGNMNVENVTLSAQCWGANDSATNFGMNRIFFDTEKINSPFSNASTPVKDGYGQEVGEISLFNSDYFINEQGGVSLGDLEYHGTNIKSGSYIILMNPKSSINYRMWFWNLPTVYKIPITHFICNFDVVSQSPHYVTNLQVDITIAQ